MISRMKPKSNNLPAVAKGYGECLASGKIISDGLAINFMFRDKPTHKKDSGWRFFSGYEYERYNSNPKNFATFDVNVLANHDADIVPFLGAKIGSAFERDLVSGKFLPANEIGEERNIAAS